MNRPLENKVALITGAGSGIGRATALEFAAQGARLTLADIDESAGQETAQLLAEMGGDAIHLRCDVTDATEVKRLVAACVERYGRLDCAFNNAGIGGGSARLADYPE